MSRQAAEEHSPLQVVGIPATIDNDIGCTHYTIGFDTACNTAIACIDKLRDTMQSHERCSLVEVMGRHAGYLALYVGIAVGATAVLIPEHEVDFERDIADKIRRARLSGSTHYMIVVAEGAGSAMDYANRIRQEIGIDPRVTVLGRFRRHEQKNRTSFGRAVHFRFHSAQGGSAAAAKWKAQTAAAWGRSPAVPPAC